jgi:hypothetical protein
LEFICNPCGTGPFFGGMVLVSLFVFFMFTSYTTTLYTGLVTVA